MKAMYEALFREKEGWVNVKNQTRRQSLKLQRITPRKQACMSAQSLFATPWTVTCQDPLSMGIFRQEYWSGLPFPTPHRSRTGSQTRKWKHVPDWDFRTAMEHCHVSPVSPVWTAVFLFVFFFFNRSIYCICLIPITPLSAVFVLQTTWLFFYRYSDEEEPCPKRLIHS